MITLLTFANTRGVKLGAAVQNVFTSAKVLALLGIVLVGVVAKNAGAIAANFGRLAAVLGWSPGLHTRHPVQVGSFFGLGGGDTVVGIFTVDCCGAGGVAV